tara:strand:+ start:3270 stop:4256 length:987 start_codon:yes stop_codon:yes gene_type:complete
MKKLALISTYCNTKEKQEILIDNIKSFQELGVDTLIFSPKGILPQDIINLSNHCILTEENPVPPLTTRSQLLYKFPKSDLSLRHTLVYLDYGWASLNQLKKLFYYGASLDYDLYYPTMYDLIFTPEIKNVIESNETNYFFSNKRPNGDFFEFAASFGVFDKNYCGQISSQITLNKYLKYTAAEYYYGDIQKSLNLPTHNYVTEDLFFEHGSPPHFNISNTDEIKIFVDNTRFSPNNYDPKEGNKEVGIHFYDVKSPTKVKIQTQNKTSEYLIEQEQILFVDLDNPKIDIIINDAKLDISDLNSYPITEIKIDDNNEWDYIKKHGTSKL